MNCKVIAKEGATLPLYQTEGSAGADICAYLPTGDLSIKPGEYLAVPTGLYFEIPKGFEMQVRPRSGLARKFGVTVLNAPGTVDCDYRGEVQVLLINHGKDVFKISNGDRIAQLVFQSVVTMNFTVVSELSDTKRGDGGFGSTGV